MNHCPFHFYLLLKTLLPVVIGISSAGCIFSDDNAKVGGPSTLALGAYHTLSPGDACRAGGKANFCSTENVEEILELSSRKPDIVRIFTSEELPEGVVPNDGATPFYVYGAEAGVAKLDFEAVFDDGSTRSDVQEIEVRRPTHMLIDGNCFPTDQEQPRALMPVGMQTTFYVHLHDENSRLEGWMPDVLDGFEAPFTHSNMMRFTFSADVEGTTPLTTPLFDEPVGAITVYGPQDVDGVTIALRTTSARAAFVAPLLDTYLDTMVQIDGQVACRTIPVELIALSPNICTGPEGAERWMAEGQSEKITIVDEGSCHLGATAVPGQSPVSETTIPLFIVSDRTSVFGGFGEPCDMEGASVCIHGFSAVGRCRDGRWIEHMVCPDDQVCDWMSDTEAGCRKLR